MSKPAAAPPSSSKAAAPSAGKSAATKAQKPRISKDERRKQRKVKNPLFVGKTRNFGIGQAVQPHRDISRFVKWPQYIKLQRQQRVLLQRLSIPPAIHQFSTTLPKKDADDLFSLLNKIKPETPEAKKARLVTEAKARADGKPAPKTAKPVVVKFGLNHVTNLVESGEAKLVVIAHDVDPVELVLWLPALCKHSDIPYCIVKEKARLGRVVGMKTATCLAVTSVKDEDKVAFNNVVSACRSYYNNQFDVIRKSHGGKKMGNKTLTKLALRKAQLSKEAAEKAKLAG